MQVTRFSDDIIQAQRTHDKSIAYDFNLNLHPVCAVNVLLNNEQILDHFFKQLCLRVITLCNYDFILGLKTKCKVRLRNLPTFSFCLLK